MKSPRYSNVSNVHKQFSVLLQAGFDAGDAIRYYALPGSMTSSVLNLASSSNCGVAGRWMFRIDGLNIQLPNAAALKGL
jgi:hypothetical protein